MHDISKLVQTDYCAWPNLFRINATTIGAVIFNRPSHGLEEGSLELWTCDGSGQNWQYVSTPCPNPPGQNRMHCSCGVSDNGDIHVLSTGFSISKRQFIKLEPLWHSVSADTGESWQVTHNIDVQGIENHHIPHGAILNDKDGVLVATVYRSFGTGKPSKTWLIQSNDGGLNWSCISQIGDGDTNEAYLVASADQRIAATRTHVDHHTRLFTNSHSSSTWQDRGPLTLPMQHPGHLTVINGNGLLLTYGIRNKGLMAIAGRYSDNLGNSWGAPFVIHQFPSTTTDCGYPSTVMLDNDKVLTGYYTNASLEYEGYQFGVLHWQLSTFLSPRELDSISDGKKLKT